MIKDVAGELLEKIEWLENIFAVFFIGNLVTGFYLMFRLPSSPWGMRLFLVSSGFMLLMVFYKHLFLLVVLLFIVIRHNLLKLFAKK